ncbi:MAG: hypothetical protein DSZ32_01715 [Gammaproteobacteria bacterium]|nr:MAG: hypothetical protein DSZ32_01715 [Gammaproteobacteria bacterium]
MHTKTYWFAFQLSLILLAAPSAHALTFGELADQGAGEKDEQRQNTDRGYGKEPDYSSPASVSRYSCQVPEKVEQDVPRYDARPGGYGRDYGMPVPRYDPYFDPYTPRPYYGYYNYNEPGWSRRQAEQWWLRRR